MVALLWKEYREKRLWALLLFVTTSGVVLAGKSYTFCGDYAVADIVFLSMISALVIGCGVYDSEISKGAAVFLYSRPVSWKRVLFAKVFVGISMIVIAAFLAAAVYRLVCPEQLLPFATPSRLLLGVGLGIGLMTLAFLAGVVSSVALPGVSGGLAVFFSLCILYGLYMNLTLQGSGYIPDVRWLAVSAAWFVAAVAAALFTVRFGVTLNTPTRVKRFAGVFVPLTLLLSAIAHAPAFERDFGKVTLDSYSFLCPSPDGRYAVAQWPIEPGSRELADGVYLLRLADGARIKISRRTTPIVQCYWIDSFRFVIRQTGDKVVQVLDFKPLEGRSVAAIVITPIRVRHDKVVLVPSPDRRMAIEVSGGHISANRVTLDSLWESTRYPGRDGTAIRVLDVDAGRATRTRVDGVQDYWWQSNTEIGYTDSTGKRHIVSVLDERTEDT